MKSEKRIDLVLRDSRSQNRSGPQSSQSGHPPSLDLVLECPLTASETSTTLKLQVWLKATRPQPELAPGQSQFVTNSGRILLSAFLKVFSLLRVTDTRSSGKFFSRSGLFAKRGGETFGRDPPTLILGCGAPDTGDTRDRVSLRAGNGVFAIAEQSVTRPLQCPCREKRTANTKHVNTTHACSLLHNTPQTCVSSHTARK